MKELTIENEINKLKEVWREQRFELGKYMKGLEDRGWVLRQTEEVSAWSSCHVLVLALGAMAAVAVIQRLKPCLPLEPWAGPVLLAYQPFSYSNAALSSANHSAFTQPVPHLS